jgi:hypothetical protein
MKVKMKVLKAKSTESGDDNVSYGSENDNDDHDDDNEDDAKENQQVVPRRSKRIQEQKEQESQGILKKFGWFMKMNGSEKALNYHQAKISSKWRKYREAMIDFIQKLDENNGFTIVPKPDNANIIGSRWVFVDKYDASGRFVKAKAII